MTSCGDFGWQTTREVDAACVRLGSTNSMISVAGSSTSDESVVVKQGDEGSLALVFGGSRQLSSRVAPGG